MTLSLIKERGSNRYLFQHIEGMKEVQWIVDGADVDLDVLVDIINTVSPPLNGTVPAIPLGSNSGTQLPLMPGWNNVKVEWNAGAEAANKAAQEEEMRLRNMGSALGKGINLGPEDIPVFNGEAGDELPPVNWGQ